MNIELIVVKWNSDGTRGCPKGETFTSGWFDGTEEPFGAWFTSADPEDTFILAQNCGDGVMWSSDKEQTIQVKEVIEWAPCELDLVDVPNGE